MVCRPSQRLDQKEGLVRETPTSLAIFLVLFGLGSLYYSVNMLAMGLADSAPMVSSRILQLLCLAGLGLSGSVSIGTGLMFGRLHARGSLLPKAITYTGLVCSLLTMFMPGLALSCYLAYQLQQLPAPAPLQPSDSAEEATP